MTLWTALVAEALACTPFELSGSLLPPRLLEPPPIARAAGLSPLALLAALIVTQTLTGAAGGIALDARVPALARCCSRSARRSSSWSSPLRRRRRSAACSDRCG